MPLTSTDSLVAFYIAYIGIEFISPSRAFDSTEASDRTEASAESRLDESEEKLNQKSPIQDENGFVTDEESKLTSCIIESEEESTCEDGGGCIDENYSTVDEEIEDGCKAKILHFLQDACLSELTLIPQCSEKKVQKIIALRPFNSWKALVGLHSSFPIPSLLRVKVASA